MPSLYLPILASLNSYGVGGLEAPSGPSLYESFLGNPEILFQDLLDDPSRYEPGVDALLQNMIGGRTFADLTSEEKEMLNRATIEYSQSTPRKAQEEKPPPPVIPAEDPWEL